MDKMDICCKRRGYINVGDMEQRNHRCKIKLLKFFIKVFVIFIAVGYSLFLPGLAYSSMHYRNPYAEGYDLTKCTLVEGSVKFLGECKPECDNDPTRCNYFNRWVAIWKTLDGSTAVINPWSSSTNMNQPARDLKSHPVGWTYDCLCRSNPDKYPNVSRLEYCDIWGSCILEIDSLDYMREQSELMNNDGINLISSGVIIMISSLLIALVLLILKRRCQ